jgi:hypothetical protein
LTDGPHASAALNANLDNAFLLALNYFAGEAEHTRKSNICCHGHSAGILLLVWRKMRNQKA